MLVNIKRSQYDGWFGTTYYVVDAIVEPTPDEAELITKHNVGDLVIFDSEQHKEHMEAAGKHGNDVTDTLSSAPIIPKGSTEDMFLGFLSGVGSIMWSLTAGTYNLIFASLGTTVTVQTLLDGAHIESDNASEVLESEQLIRKAIARLQAHLENLRSFDGREELYEPE